MSAQAAATAGTTPAMSVGVADQPSYRPMSRSRGLSVGFSGTGTSVTTTDGDDKRTQYGYGYRSYYNMCGPGFYPSTYNYYGYGYPSYPIYGTGGDWIGIGTTPPVIGTIEPQPDGRVVNGRGYTQLRDRQAEPAPRINGNSNGSGWSGSSGGASSGGYSSGSSSSGSSGGSGGGSGGDSGARVAVPQGGGQ